MKGGSPPSPCIPSCACGSSGPALSHGSPWSWQGLSWCICRGGNEQILRPHYLQNTPKLDLGVLATGGMLLVSNLMMLSLDQSDSDWITHTDIAHDIQLLSLFPGQSVDLLFISNMFFFQDLISFKRCFFYFMVCQYYPNKAPNLCKKNMNIYYPHP